MSVFSVKGLTAMKLMKFSATSALVLLSKASRYSNKISFDTHKINLPRVIQSKIQRNGYFLPIMAIKMFMSTTILSAIIFIRPINHILRGQFLPSQTSSIASDTWSAKYFANISLISCRFFSETPLEYIFRSSICKLLNSYIGINFTSFEVSILV